MNESYLPFIMESDLYFDQINRFKDNKILMPNFLNSNFKKISPCWKNSSDRIIMITHDMMGGYQEDNQISLKFPQKGYFFRFQHYMSSTVFNYFSHHFITIPPLSYIKIAHQLNNKILGTIIIEYSQQHYDQIIKDYQSSDKQLTNKLLQILQDKNFDGYLLNFETSSKNVNLIISWIKYFHQEIKKLNPSYLLIWYDSLTENGFVNWEGKVSKDNEIFTEITDLFFLDYRWNSKSIESSLQNTSKDKIMLSIDIFGRSNIGKFESEKLSKISKDKDLSLDIFAPGYVYEREGGMKLKENYKVNEKKLWLGYSEDILFENIQFEKRMQIPINDIFQKSQGIDLSFLIKIDNPKNQLLKYLIHIVFKNSDNQIIGCINTKRRYYQTKNCNFDEIQNQNLLRQISDDQFTERLILYKSKFYNKIDQFQNAIVYVKHQCQKEQLCKDIKFSDFQITQLIQQKTALVKDLITKTLIALPINTFFNIGQGNKYFINGRLTKFSNYNYLLDYDINIEFSERPYTLKDKILENPLQNYELNLNYSDAYFGTSSLQISAILFPEFYLSHVLYELQLDKKIIFIRIVYKNNVSYKKQSRFNFQLYDDQGKQKKRKIRRDKLENGWISDLYIYHNIKGKYFLTVNAFSNQDYFSKVNMVDLKIGQISIFDDNRINDLEIDKDFIYIDYEMRKVQSEIKNKLIFDLYLNIQILEDIFKINKCILTKDSSFLHSLYFNQYIIKKLIYDEQQPDQNIIQIICLTQNGQFIPVKQKIIIKKNLIKPFDYVK